MGPRSVLAAVDDEPILADTKQAWADYGWVYPGYKPTGCQAHGEDKMPKQEPEKLSHKEVTKIRKEAWKAFNEDNQSDEDTDLEFYTPKAVIRDMIEFLKTYDPQ